MASSVEPLAGVALLAFPDMCDWLASELRGRFSIDSASAGAVRYGNLLYVPKGNFASSYSNVAADINAPMPIAQRDDFYDSPMAHTHTPMPYFCKCAMLAPLLIHFDSIGDAARALRNIQRTWAAYNYQFFRRSALIQGKLPYVNFKPRMFPAKIPRVPIGLYTLIDEHTMLASAKTTSLFPAGGIQFVENHTDPPSRAYLKLWEALTLVQVFFDAPLPQNCARCFDAGASPGGWTWALVNFGCRVFAVDRAELAPTLMKNPLVEFRQGDALALKPEEVGDCDFVLSDVACYPTRLYEWVVKWLSSGLAKNMICTIKLQGEHKWNIIDKFAALPQSHVVHLNYNKHELTWLWRKDGAEKARKP